LPAFIDSDNIPLLKNWLERMVEPFRDQEIIAVLLLINNDKKEFVLARQLFQK
jgi:hypothetical protein